MERPMHTHTARRIMLIAFPLLAIGGIVYGFSAVTPPAPASRPLEVDIVEAPSFEESAHPTFWLNSGALATQKDGAVRTFDGELSDAYWNPLYAATNPSDTDGGIHPQNIFRLLTKSSFKDAAVEAAVTITRLIESDSPNRNESNGALLMLRYLDGDNLYYAGLRVDGTAIIKKKTDGVYRTLAQTPVFVFADYDREKMPNLLPLNVPLGMRAEVRNLEGSKVGVTLSIDIGMNGTWVPVLSYVDEPAPGVPVIRDAGHVGLRTDFMEATMTGFRIESL